MKSNPSFMRNMAAWLTAIVLFCPLYKIWGQGDTISLETKYTKYNVPSTFDATFKYDDDKKNFKKLRSYFFEQSELKERLNILMNHYSRYESPDTIQIIKALAEIEGWLKNASTSPAVKVSANQYAQYQYLSREEDPYSYYLSQLDSDQEQTLDTGKVKELQLSLQLRKSWALKKRQEYITLLSNITTLEKDIKSCDRTIDEALRPESEEQKFRTWMSIVFAALIGILLFVFFFLIYKRGDKNIAKDLLSELGLQFITLFVLIIAVILFGILSILKGSELAAILAGISGYILGSKSTAIARNSESNPSSNPESNQSTTTAQP